MYGSRAKSLIDRRIEFSLSRLGEILITWVLLALPFNQAFAQGTIDRETSTENDNGPIETAVAAISSRDLTSNIDQTVDRIIESVRQTIPARQVERVAPTYPRTMLERRREGWVRVTYCIDESGQTQNVAVLDSVGGSGFETAALRTVRKWQFEPATLEGEPIWQSRNETYINFAIEGFSGVASDVFVSRVRKIRNLVEEGKLEDADRMFWKTYEKSNLTLFELGNLWVTRVQIDSKFRDLYRLNMALHRATALDGRMIQKQSYWKLLKLRVQVEAGLGKWHEALTSYKKLYKSAGPENENVVAVKPTIDKIFEQLRSNQPLLINAEVRQSGECANCNNSWDFTPVRNEFGIANTNGELNSIEMRCDNKRFESSVADDTKWKIPSSWGKCHVQIYGEPGTTFEVILFPGSA